MTPLYWGFDVAGTGSTDHGDLCGDSRPERRKPCSPFALLPAVGYGRTGEILADMTDETVNWIEGTRFSGITEAEKIQAW